MNYAVLSAWAYTAGLLSGNDCCSSAIGFRKKAPFDRTAAYWGNFKQALDLRNSLTHPKTLPPKVTEQSVERALQAVLQLLDVAYQRIYNKKYPARQRGLESNVEL